MKKSLKFYLLWVFILGSLIGCERNLDQDDDNDSSSEYYEDESDYQWNSLTATKIILLDNKAEISGNGAFFNNNQLLINDEGEYWICGDLSDGQIRVQAPDTDRVKLILDSVSVTCSNNPAIYVETAKKVVIILADGSTNTLTDGSSYSTGNLNAAVYSKSDLVMWGNGTLNVNANYKDGITSKDGFIIKSGTYNIAAVDDGIRGKDYLVIKGGTFTVNSGGDAFKSDNETSGFGYIDIVTGKYTVIAGGDAFQAESDLTIEDGTFNIKTINLAVSEKGLKAGDLLVINGGEYTIETVDDAVHSNQDMEISGGSFNISTGDDGFHADNALTIDYADIIINQSYEGIEAKTLTIKDGNITINSSDDGLNAASGDGSSNDPMHPGSGSSNNNLILEGGTIFVYASGDGVDINGSITMTGGCLVVHGPTANDNGALDYDGSFMISGGFMVAAGSSGMAQAPGTSSTQYSVLINFTSTYNANTLFCLQDDSGNDIAVFSPQHRFQSIALSSSALGKGKNYKIYIGGTSTGTETGGLYKGETYTPGTLYKTFTISSITTYIGNTGGGGGPGFP